MVAKQRRHHQARNSINLAFPPPLVKVEKSQGAILDFSLKSFLLKICASDEDPRPHIDPEESVFSANQGKHQQGKEVLVVVIVTPRFGFFMAICFPSSAPTAWGTFHLFLNFSSMFLHCLGPVGQHKYSSQNSARITPQTLGMRWWFGQPGSDTTRRRRSLLLPGVSVLLPVLIQLLRAFWAW